MNSFTENILSWYNKSKKNFPWRGQIDPYKIWVSEIMLQQTQVETVIPYYNNWLLKFPTIQDVANASDDELFKYWEGLGYYQRVQNLRQACIQILNDYDGTIPNNKTDLMKLKGIGDYTSSAIASIAFNKINYVVDGNVKRIMSRLLCLPNFLSKSMNKIDTFLFNHISHRHPGDFNQALMDLGRYICTPRNPKCLNCPISEYCKSYLEDKTASYPKKNNAKKIIPHYQIGVGVIWHKNKILITKRKKEGLLGGLWEFPGGKIKKNESHIDCITREIKEELSIKVDVSDFIVKVDHKYSHFSITLHAYHCHYKAGKIKCNAADQFKWIDINSFSKYPFPKANHHIFPYINNYQSAVC